MITSKIQRSLLAVLLLALTANISCGMQGNWPAMTDNDLPQFKQQLEANARIQRLMPDGGGAVMSIPVPLKSGEALIFIHRIGGLPPNRPQVYAPHYHIKASYPSGEVISIEAITPVPLGILLAEGESPGEDVELSSDEFEILQNEFSRLYSTAIYIYLTKQSPNPERCKRLLELLPVVTRVQLLPYLRRANPDFFDFIDRCAASHSIRTATRLDQPVQKLAGVLARLQSLPVFNKEAIESALAVNLRPVPNANRYYKFYRADFSPKEPFASLEFSEPGEGAASDEQSLNLLVDPQSQITYQEIREQFGTGVISQIIPDAKPDGLVTYSYEASSGRLSFTCNRRTYQLTSAVLVRNQRQRGPSPSN